MPDLSPFSYNVVYNLLSLTVATMGAASIYFFFAPRVSNRYRPAMIVTGLVTTIAMYHYWQIRGSWAASFSLVDGTYAYQEGSPFNDFYRYADWLLTVPLLIVELVAVLALAKSESRRLLGMLVPAVILMIVLGYPGEAQISQMVAGQGASQAAIWGFFIASMIPFLFILAVLYTKFSDSISSQPPRVQGLVKLARTLILITWSFYPVAYVIGALGGKTAAGVIGLQVGYTIADITAKAGFGLVIYLIARAKTEADGPAPALEGQSPAGQPATA
jgi:bacteriorhodopsin